MYHRIKYLGLVLVMLLGLYPIAELTRIIVVGGEYYFPNMKGQFGAEVALMWVLYLSIVPVFLLVNNTRLRRYRNKKSEILRQAEMKRNLSLLTQRKEDYIRVDYHG